MYICEFCGREFSSAGGINGHRNAHLIRNAAGHRIGLPCEVCDDTTYYQMQGIPYHPDCFEQRWQDDEEYEAEWKRPRKTKKKSGIKLLPSSLTTGLSEMTQMITGRKETKNADTDRWAGACIFPDGSCRQLDFAACNAAGGKFQSPQTSCNNTNRWVDSHLARDFNEDHWYRNYQAEDRPEEERMTRETAENLVAQILGWLEPFTEFAEVCGSYRRGREDPGDLDVVIILKSRVSLPEIAELWLAEGKASAVNWVGEKKTQMVIEGVKVDIRTSTPRALGAALLYFTGPSGYNIGIRSAAKRAGFKLNEYGLFNRETGEYVAGATEEDIYTALGRNYRPPTERRAEGTDGYLWKFSDQELIEMHRQGKINQTQLQQGITGKIKRVHPNDLYPVMRSETFDATVVHKGKRPKGAVSQAMLNKKMMDEAEVMEAIHKLENAVRLGLISEEEVMESLHKKFGAESNNGNQVFNSCWKCGSGLHLWQIYRYPATPSEITGVGGDPTEANESHNTPREDWGKDWEKTVATSLYCGTCNRTEEDCYEAGCGEFDSSAFRAEVVHQRYSNNGWSLYGRKLYRYGDLQGSIRGNISLTTEKPIQRNDPNETYAGRYHVLWVHGADNELFNQVSQQIKPESFDEWMDVIHETNRRMNPKKTHHSETKDVFEHHGLMKDHRCSCGGVMETHPEFFKCHLCGKELDALEFGAETQDFADRFEIQIRTSRGNTTERIPVGRSMLVRRLREILGRQRQPYAVDVFGTEAAFNYMGPYGMQVYRPKPQLLATYKYGRFESGEMADHLNEKLGLY